jgi:hypothetical protein
MSFIFCKQPDFCDFYHVVKNVCCLFTRQSQVARGFTVNKEVLTDTMREQSLISQRRVYAQ